VAVRKLAYEHEGTLVELELADKPLTFGRSDESDYPLPDKLASRIHAQVFPRDGEWWVEDLNSSNGTYLNGKKVSASARLSHGDVIGVGTTRLTFISDTRQGPPETQLARLLYTAKGAAAPVEVMIRERVSIGRKPVNTLQVDDKKVSGHHCEVVRHGSSYMLRDLNSSNGTFVGKRKIKEHILRNGDVFSPGQGGQIYFVDPAQPHEQPPPAQPQGPSERGVFEPVMAEPAAPQRPNLLKLALPGVVVALVLTVAGWWLGGMIHEFRSRTPQAAERAERLLPLPDAALSFEGAIDEYGNPEGWSAAFEASGGASVELLADHEVAYDGKHSLSVRVSRLVGNSTLVLTARDARPVATPGDVRVRLQARATGIRRIAVGFAIVDDSGVAHLLASESFNDLQSGNWTELTLSGIALQSLPESGRFQLMISGAYSSLWLDRLEVEFESERYVDPLQRAAATDVRAALDRQLPIRVSFPARPQAAEAMPVILGPGDEQLSEFSGWSVSQTSARVLRYRAFMPARATTAAVELEASSIESLLFNTSGLELRWSLRNAASGETLSIRLDLPMPEESEILIADRRGAPLVVDRDGVHAYSYATVSELAVTRTDLALSFPDGAVVWFEMSRPGRLSVQVRAAAADARSSLRMQAFSRAHMHARLYQRLYDEAQRLWAARHGSAAQARLQYLADIEDDAGLPIIQRARRDLEALFIAHKELRDEVEQAWQRAESARTLEALTAAEALIRRYVSVWSGAHDVTLVGGRLREIEDWRSEIRARQRTPEEQRRAEAVARTLWADAQRSHEGGDLLMAMLLLENLLRDYAQTSVYRSAEVLHERIQARLQDPVERDRIIDEELSKIDEDIRFRDYDLAREKCLNLFKRFPDTPRNREIMQRLRQVEDAFRE
jgi:pSer/pThr/pTyr-binding forkhead associated (FHA) protein